MSLANEIKRLRELKGWRATDLASKAEVNPSILSRIESGAIKKPTGGTLGKLAKALDASPQSLIRLTNEQRPGPAGLHVGFAHCLWSAPAILLAMRGGVPGVSLSGFGVLGGGGGPRLGEPHWYEPQTIRAQGYLRVGPRYVEAGAPPLPEARPWPEDTPIRTYTAQDLTTLLISGTPPLDGIIASYQALESYGKVVSPFAQLLNEHSGCSLFLALKRRTYDRILASRKARGAVGKPSEARMFRRVWRELTRCPDTPLPALYAPATIAEKQFRILSRKRTPPPDSKQGRHPAPNLRRVQADLGSWTSFRQAAIEELTRSGCFLFIGWEPQVSLLSKSLKECDEAVCLPPQPMALVVPRRRPPHLSFDVIFRKSAVEGPAQREAVDELLTLLAAAVHEIKDARGKETDAVTRVAAYLNMNAVECGKALSDLNFSMMYHHDWVDFVRR